MEREPVFFNISGSTEDPGVGGTIFQGRQVSAYTVFTVPQGKVYIGGGYARCTAVSRRPQQRLRRHRL
jgi:hypothetical protein